ncbi:DUF3545 domain-containing protein [Vibrio albus]|jgi:hypothetical protein|uniref:DUF3545 domain-containing protein n=1 Tax=Vibrio albus TaxID=2200953 RepID=A0A2U3BEY3_9VIBR|nr:DUF3545 family protein [Vibrio albus]PWI35324.1 DUF3545 domain-containing protein [Vibrio albus]
MNGFLLDDIMTTESQPARATRSKPVKRKWREIEAIKDRQRLQKELMELDICCDYSLDEIDL